MKLTQEKTYLGDGVYASFDGQSIVLQACNGIVWHDTIYLEVEVFEALYKYGLAHGFKVKESD